MVRKPGIGNYAVVYHLCEALSDPCLSDMIISILEVSSNSIIPPHRSSTTATGREYSIKLLSNANLDEDALVA